MIWPTLPPFLFIPRCLVLYAVREIRSFVNKILSAFCWLKTWGEGKNSFAFILAECSSICEHPKELNNLTINSVFFLFFFNIRWIDQLVMCSPSVLGSHCLCIHWERLWESNSGCNTSIAGKSPLLYKLYMVVQTLLSIMVATNIKIWLLCIQRDMLLVFSQWWNSLNECKCLYFLICEILIDIGGWLSCLSSLIMKLITSLTCFSSNNSVLDLDYISHYFHTLFEHYYTMPKIALRFCRWDLCWVSGSLY